MDFEDVRNIRIKEKENSSLSDIPKNFFQEVSRLIDNLENPKKTKNTVAMVKDIFKRREQKIARSALRAARTDEKRIENVTKKEKELYKNLVEDFTTHRDRLKRVKNSENLEENKTNKNKEEKKEYLVRTLERVPKFTGSESSEHGPYEPNQIVKMPRKEAKILLKKELVEEVEK